jgi:hypothetical protein
MNRTVLIHCFLALVLLSACKKNQFDGVTSNKPAIPVTVSNIYGMYNGVPAISTSANGGGTIAITLTIPASSGRTIKEITRVAVASTPSNYKVVEGTTGLYNTAPIQGTGTSVTFNTTLSEFTSKTGIAAPSPGTATSFLNRYFMFLITLDNGDQIYPVGVRVYVAS